MFGGLAPIKRTEIGLGKSVDVRKVNGTEKARVKAQVSLPSITTTARVNSAKKLMGKTEAQTKLLQKHSQYSIAIANNLVTAHEVRAKHSKAMMEIDQKLQVIGITHGKEVSDYQLESAGNVAYLNGYQQQMEIANAIIEF
jgi:hypothetical protein